MKIRTVSKSAKSGNNRLAEAKKNTTKLA